MNIVIVIQARTSSTRLPNKVLLPLAGKPLLQRLIERVQATQRMYDIVVATTEDASDDPIRKLCRSLNVPCFSGHPTDLLDRHYRAATARHADVVVKIPSDCPLIDPAIIDMVIGFFVSRIKPFDYVSNLHPASYPDGNDVEVMTMEALEIAWKEASKNYEREHTTPFFWEQPERFVIGNVMWESGLDYSMTHRWTIDYEQDYHFIKRVYDELWSEYRPVFSMNNILRLLHEKPELQKINSQFAGVNWYRHHLGELRTITKEFTRMINTL
jgi:spore coat polysaccharide biosynthesis protein SpsF